MELIGQVSSKIQDHLPASYLSWTQASSAMPQLLRKDGQKCWAAGSCKPSTWGGWRAGKQARRPLLRLQSPLSESPGLWRGWRRWSAEEGWTGPLLQQVHCLHAHRQSVQANGEETGWSLLGVSGPVWINASDPTRLFSSAAYGFYAPPIEVMIPYVKDIVKALFHKSTLSEDV